MFRQIVRLAVVALSAALVFAFTQLPAQADVPRRIGYQGYLTDSAGAPRNGNFSITFRLYSAASGGTSLWTETQPSVSVANGIFNATLGSVTPLTLPFDTQYYLGVTVGTDGEMSPRQALLSSPYAFHAVLAAGLASPTFSHWTSIGNSAMGGTTFINRHNWLAKADGNTLRVKVCRQQLGAASITCSSSSVLLPDPGSSNTWVPAGVQPYMDNGTIASAAWFTSGAGEMILVCLYSTGTAPTCSSATAIGS